MAEIYLTKEGKTYLGEKEELNLIKKALLSVTSSYRHLVDTFVPQRLREALDKISLKDYKIQRKINLSEDQCKLYSKTRFYQWNLTYEHEGKVYRRKLLEIPYVDLMNKVVINGFSKTFSNKYKRRNLYLHKRDRSVDLFLTNIRNKKIRLEIGSEGGLNLWFNESNPVPLLSYLVKNYGSRETADVFFGGYTETPKQDSNVKFDQIFVDPRNSLFSLEDLDFNLERSNSSLGPFLILDRDKSLVRRLTKVEDFEDLLEPKIIFKLISWVRRELAIDLEETELKVEKFVNRSWLTCGGYIRDILERAIVLRDLQAMEPGADVSIYLDNVLSKLNLTSIKSKINAYIFDGTFTQMLEDSNPLAELIHIRKVSLLYKGLLSRRTATLALRDTELYLQGRFCPISTTEGETIGIIKHLALLATFDEEDNLLVPYLPVNKGKIKNEIRWLSMEEEYNLYLTDLNSFESEDRLVKARFNNRIVLVERDKLDYVMTVYGQTASLGINLLPRANSSEPDRMLMASNMSRQALILKWSDSPYVKTKSFQLLTQIYEELNEQEQEEGAECLYQSAKTLVISHDNKDLSIVEASQISSSNNSSVKCGRLTFDKKTSNVRYSSYFSEGSNLELGRNLKVAYMDWKGYSFEDSIVLSDRIEREELFNSLHIETFTVPVFKTVHGEETITRDIINPERFDLSKLDEQGVVKVGSYVRSNDILVAKVSPKIKKEETPEQRLLMAILGEKSQGVKNNFFTVPESIKEAFVHKVEFYRGKLNRESFQRWSDGERTSILLERDELIKNLNSKRKLSLGQLKQIQKHYEQRINSVETNLSKEECLFAVKVTLIVEKPLVVGDKITGLHGNKGVVSKIANQADLPFDADGRTIDIVISHLSVYGRLNFSQIHESYLSSLRERLLSSLDIALSYPDQSASKDLIKAFKDTVNFKGDDSKLHAYVKSKPGFILKNYSSLDEDQISSLEKISNFSEGRILRCGQDNVEFSSPIHVGFAYFLKLVHTVDSKYSSRAIGSNSIKFNQPSRGKTGFENDKLVSNGRAQKIGVMEKDALIARGVVNLLHELFTVRSDATVMRNKILSGEFIDIDFSDKLLTTESTKVFFYILNVLGFHCDRFYNLEGGLKALRFRLMREEDVERFSRGAVDTADTLHYKTRRGIIGGIFCPKIFGGSKNNSCDCGKYADRRYQGMECPICNVTVHSNKTRKDFFGHINLEVPMVNSLLLSDKLIQYLTNCSFKTLKDLTYHKLFVRKDSPKNEIWFTKEHDSKISYSGGEALRRLIRDIEPRKIYRDKVVESHRAYLGGKSQERMPSIIQRLRGFILAGNSLDSLIINKLLVLPKNLRPLMLSDNDSYITTEINSKYQQIVRRHKFLVELRNSSLLAFTIEHAKLFLQQSIDNLLTGAFEDVDTSLLSQIKGKEGVARKHLLSKRVNFSGRSTISLSPFLPMNFCQVPKNMLIKIMLPLVQKELVRRGVCESFYEAFEYVKNSKQEDLNDILIDICKKVPIIFNRNPSLHSLSFQAYHAIPSDQKSIGLHPLVCKALGADIDGDTGQIIAVITERAQREVVDKMCGRNSFNPSNFELVVKPTRELALGIYYFSLEDPSSVKLSLFNLKDCQLMLDRFGPHQRLSWQEFPDKTTTVGRLCIFERWLSLLSRDSHHLMGEKFDLINRIWSKENLEQNLEILADVSRCSVHQINEFCDYLKDVGLNWTSRSGYSFLLEDIRKAVSPETKALARDLNEAIYDIQNSVDMGLVDQREEQELMVNEFSKLEEDLNQRTQRDLRDTSQEAVVLSGYRGSWSSLTYMCKLRGVVSLKKGYSYPVISSLYQGYNEMDFALLSTIISKLITKSLGTAVGGYFNRRMVELLREAKVVEHDCGTQEGVEIPHKGDFKNWAGRVLAEEVDGIKPGHILNMEEARTLMRQHISLKLRSPLSCQSKLGVCQMCYGNLPGERDLVNLGKSVGTLAAHAMSEPVTQMLLQSKHVRKLSLHESNLEVLHGFKSEGQLRLNFEENLLKKEADYWLFVGNVGEIFSGKESFELQHGDRLLKIEGNLERDEALVGRNLNQGIYADQEAVVVLKEDHLVLKYDDGSQRRFYMDLEKSTLKVGDGEKVQKGKLLFEVRSEEERAGGQSSFNLINQFFNETSKPKEELFNFHLKAPGKGLIRYQGGRLTFWCDDFKQSWSVREPHRLIFRDGKVEKGDLIYRGRQGYHFMDKFLSGDIDAFASYCLNNLVDIYSSEGINISLIHVEIILMQMFLLAKDWRSEIFNINWMESKGIQFKILSRNLGEAYMDMNSPLSQLGYENIRKNLIDMGVGGCLDKLSSINSNLMLGNKIPLEDNYKVDES